MKNYWNVWERGFASDYCDLIINKALQLPVHEATVGFDEHNRVDTKYRRSKLRWISRSDFSWESVFIVVENFIHTANNNVFGFDVTRIAEMQFTEYDEGDEGKYDWHEDLDWLDTGFSQRKVSIVIQLTEGDEYEGGELELVAPVSGGQAVTVVKSKGTVAAFPSFISHRVKPVTKGKRYSLVAWMQGPKFR